VKKSKYPKPKHVAVQGKKLTPEQVAYFVSYYDAHGVIPGNKIVCNETGKLTTCVGPWMRKKIDQFGGVEGLLTNYVSTKNRKSGGKPLAKKIKGKKGEAQRRNTKSVKEPKDSKPKATKKPRAPRQKKEKVLSERALKMRKKAEILSNMPKFKQSPPRKLSLAELTDITKNTCLRPDIYLNNGRHCVGCFHFEYCSCHLKNLPKGMRYQAGKFVEK
jgi:hypothetical protein